MRLADVPDYPVAGADARRAGGLYASCIALSRATYAREGA